MRNFQILHKFQNCLSSRILVQISSKLVRLKGLDQYFEKFFVLPHFPLISVVFEEGRKSQIFAFFVLNPSSNATEIKGK